MITERKMKKESGKVQRIYTCFFRLILSSLFILPVISHAQSDYSVRKSAPLKGLKKFIVVIEEIDNELFWEGVTKKIIKEDIESKLRLAGIKVAPIEESPEIPWLYVRITSLYSETGQFSYNISLDMNANATVEFNGELAAGATIWSSDLLVTVDKDHVKESIRGNIKDMMEIFLTDYHTANPG